MKDQEGRKTRRDPARIGWARRALAARDKASPVQRYEARMARLAAAEKRHSPGRWFVIRTAAGATVSLERSLNGAGFEAWTPVELQGRRRSRSVQRVEREAAILPSFVFVRADRLADIVAVSMSPTSPHPSFSILHDAGRVPLIADREIEALRGVEEGKGRAWLGQREAERRKAQRRRLAPGSFVKVTEGGFAGLEGRVVSSNEHWAAIDFGGRFTVSVATWLTGTGAVQVQD